MKCEKRHFEEEKKKQRERIASHFLVVSPQYHASREKSFYESFPFLSALSFFLYYAKNPLGGIGKRQISPRVGLGMMVIHT